MTESKETNGEHKKPTTRHLHEYGPYSSTFTNPLALWAEKWYFRSISLVLLVIIWILVVVLYPILILIGLPIDIYRYKKLGGLICCRVTTFFLVYLFSSVIGVIIFTIIYLVSWVTWPSRKRWLRWNYVWQYYWGARIFFEPGLKALGLQVEIDLPKEGLRKRPKIFFLRHASFADTLLPQGTLSKDYEMRYIVKKELIFDPALNVAGSRTPNFFLYREVGQGGIEVEIEAIRNLVKDLTPDSPVAVSIWPEGTRFSYKKRERVLESLQKKDPKAYEIAKGLKHTLLPRLGGALALLEANPCADVIFCSHVGLEAAADFKEVFQGKICNAPVKVKFEQVKFEDIPKTKEARTEWIYQHWQSMDKWIDERIQTTKQTNNNNKTNKKTN